MDSKTIGALLVGVVIGLAAGYFIWGAEEGAGQPPPTRGEWPMVPCPPGSPTMAHEVCDLITNLAMAVQPPTPDSQYCAVKAQSVKTATPLDENAASLHVHAARQAAEQGRWNECKRELDMVGE